MNIITKSEYEIHNDYFEQGQLIKEAINVFYPSFKKLNKTKEQSFDFIIKNKNLSLSEFSWHLIHIKVDGTKSQQFEIMNKIIRRFSFEKYLNLTTENDIIISGNSKAWYDVLIKDKDENEISKMFYNLLSKSNPTLFSNAVSCTNDFISLKNLSKEQIRQNEKTLNDEPFIIEEEKRDIHDWFAVKFFNVSKSFINEILEHRSFSFCQGKDYFSSLKDCNFVIDNSPQIKDNKIDMEKIQNSLNNLQETYNYLLNRGHKRNIIRNILPIGITNDIIVAGNIKAWKNLFKIKTDENSYWEIKTILNDLKQELNENYGYKF